MDKREYFLKSIQEGLYKEKGWMIRAFALVRENQKEEEVPDWMLYQSAAGFFYKDPEQNKLVQIEHKHKGGPLIDYNDELFIAKGELPFVTSDVTTSYRRILWHAIVIYYPFGTKIPFTDKEHNLGKLEDQIAANFADDVDTPELEDPKFFYPRQLELYYEAVAYLRGLAMLFVPAASPKSLTVDPKILKRRDEIFNDPKINMNDQAVAAQVEAELTTMDKDSFKGDPAERFLISKKDFKVIRKKRMIAVGSESSLTPDSRTNYIPRSLDDGIDIERFPDYNNGMRSGSYKRGVETQAGGEFFKWLVRQSLNIQSNNEDCGSRFGLPDMVTDFNKTSLLGYSIVAPKGHVVLTEDNIGSYLGKTVFLRSPGMCQEKAPDYCHVCLGPKLSANTDAIPIAFSQFGNDVMLESMGAMHGKSLEVADFDLVAEAS